MALQQTCISTTMGTPILLASPVPVVHRFLVNKIFYSSAAVGDNFNSKIIFYSNSGAVLLRHNKGCWRVKVYAVPSVRLF
jgi:hypothetical protein